MSEKTKYDRRAFMAYFGSIGLGSTLLPGVLWAQFQQQQQGPTITPAMVAGAEEIAGLHFTEEQRTAIAEGLRNLSNEVAQLHKEPLDMSVFPAIVFEPVPPGEKLPHKTKATMQRSHAPLMARPGSVEELAYAPVTQLSELVRTRKVKPSELTEMYLSRLKRYDPQLHFVINLTEERARKQAKEMDAEISRGHYRGPLHGIPWGAKDLLAVQGYPTTWGAEPYKNQMLDYDATVVKRLDDAGAILIAKLTLGALAQGDIWFGERTRNPWNPATGSSGSSAGPASATASGCVGFSIGSETNGSITSPSRTCGVAGFRPTFGRVPRTGAMALSWTTDKLGPICRSAEDTALVFNAIYGPDGYDYSVKDYPFNWNANAKLSSLRIGYFKFANQGGGRPPRNLFERMNAQGQPEPNTEALNFIKVLESLGAKPVEVEDPTPNGGYLDDLILHAEAGAAFSAPTLAGDLDVMMRSHTQFYSTWPDYFRTSQFYPAVDYVNANRARTLLCQKWWDLFQKFDVIFTPQENTSVTNVTGTPSIVVPTGFAVPVPFGGRGGRGGGRGRGDTAAAAAPPPPPPPQLPLPTWMYVMGPIYQDEKILTVANAFQSATDFHKKHPPQFP
ncbi:MAG TPA: amidase [Gemmatimonadaceae bacterium]|nr:amidase [Gemmatimonadaceae bacterium]